MLPVIQLLSKFSYFLQVRTSFFQMLFSKTRDSYMKLLNQIFKSYNSFFNTFQCCRNLPFGGRATRDSWVHLPRKEYARSRHQHLFEENIGKTGKRHDLRTLSERFGSCIYARGRYQHPTRLSQDTSAFNQMCKHDFNFMFPFTFLFLFIFFIFLRSTRVFPLLLRIP